MTGISTKPFSLLDRYLLVQLFLTIAFAIILFTIIWLAPETLFKLIQYLFAGKISANQAGLMFLYHLPPVLQQSIPIAVLVGTIFLFRRLSLQLELVSFLSCGISPFRVLWPVVFTGICFSMFHFFIQEAISPVTSPILENLYYSYDLKPKKDDNFVFVEKNRQGQLDKFFLIGQTTQEKLSDFIILYYAPNNQGGVQLSRILRAHEGRWNEKEKAWQLFNGLDYELDEEGVFRESQKFTEQWVNTSQYPAKLLRYSKMTPLNMTQQNLKEYIHLLKDGGQLQDVRFCQVRFNQKWAFPIASILFALLGAFLGMEHVRSQRNYGLTFGALIIFCYSVLVPFATNIGSLGIVPPFIAAWLPLVLTLGLACGIVVPNKRGFW